MVRTRSLAAAVLVVLSAVTARGQSPASSEKADAFWEAARKGDAATVKKLLDEGVDVNTKFRYGATALSYACDRGNLEVVKVLLARGADVNVKDTFYNATPLTWAASPAMGRKPQHAEIVGLLLKQGAQGRENALRAAVSAPDAATTRVILEHGGLSPDTLSDALESAKKNQEIVALLEQAGAKPRVELKMDEAQLARYAGTYRNTSGTEIAFIVSGGRLTGGPAGQRLTLAARTETTFGVVGSPGVTLTFRLEGGKATAIDVNQGGSSTSYSRVEGK